MWCENKNTMQESLPCIFAALDGVYRIYFGEGDAFRIPEERYVAEWAVAMLGHKNGRFVLFFDRHQVFDIAIVSMDEHNNISVLFP